MTETGRFSLNSILSAVLFASRACIGMLSINIKFMLRPNIQCERNRGKKITHPCVQMLPLTVRSQKQHFQFRGLKNSQGFSCKNSRIIRRTELWTECSTVTNIKSVRFVPVWSCERFPGTLGSKDNPKEYYWLNQFYKGYHFSILVT